MAKVAMKLRLRAGTHTCWKIDPKTGKPVTVEKKHEDGTPVMKPKLNPYTGKMVVNEKTGEPVMEPVIERVQLHLKAGDEFYSMRDLVAGDPGGKFEYAEQYTPDNESLQRPGESFEDFVNRLVAIRDERQKADAEADMVAAGDDEDDGAGDGLPKMSVAELRAMAERNNIRLGTAKSKDEIIAALRKAVQTV